MYVYVCRYVGMCVCMYACMHVCMYVCMYVCIYIYISYRMCVHVRGRQAAALPFLFGDGGGDASAAMYRDSAGGQRLMPKGRPADVGSPMTCTAIPSTHIPYHEQGGRAGY